MPPNLSITYMPPQKVTIVKLILFLCLTLFVNNVCKLIPFICATTTYVNIATCYPSGINIVTYLSIYYVCITLYLTLDTLIVMVVVRGRQHKIVHNGD